MRVFVFAAMFGASAALASAQAWSVGAAYGATEDISHRFSLDALKNHDLSGWVQYETQPEVQLRATAGTLKTTAANSERVVSPTTGSPPVVAPRMTSRVDYVTIGVSYEFVTGDFSSGVFGGIGGYRIRPDTTPVGFEFASDPKRTVLGWHLGVDGSVRIVPRLSGVGRLEVHGFEALQRRTILTTTAGLAYRF